MLIEKSRYIHFIGIGGIGTSSLAQILHHQGKKISGSDITSSEITKSLKLSGIKVFIGHNESNINRKHQLIVYSPAIPPNNSELQKARKLKIPTISYPEALGELTKNYYTIAIAGTHGKSTTTALTALILKKAGLDPTVVIGTKLKEFKNQNYRVGKSNYLVIEACEYRESFLHFHPNILIITNMEAEHLDYYKNFKKYKEAFIKLGKKIPHDGTIILNLDDKISATMKKNFKAQLQTFSSKKKTDWKLFDHQLKYKKEFSINLHPQIPGNFNLSNASFAAIAATTLNIPIKTIEKAIASYKGSWRRMEYKKIAKYKCQFIDDYGHHPTEIKLTLEAIREKHPQARILCVFQPHQYSRTYLLLKEFAKVFDDADKVIIPNIYKVRDSEKDIQKISTEKLISAIKKFHKKVHNGHSLTQTAEYIKKNHSKFDIIVTLGAGDIGSIYKML